MKPSILAAIDEVSLTGDGNVAGAAEESERQGYPLFENPFSIEDIEVFDEETLRSILSGNFGVALSDLAVSLRAAPWSLLCSIREHLSPDQWVTFLWDSRRPLPPDEVEAARRRVLDDLFWELIYWKMPELYEELTMGERIHPGIFQALEPNIRDAVVLDAGAGSGRASFESLRHGASRVYAVEPSPGLLNILRRKLSALPEEQRRIIPLQGSFEHLPLEDDSVDLALSCSAFTAEAGQGGEAGLTELKRVTKPGGKIALIWPRVEDRGWLMAHRFHYVALPLHEEMYVHFRSLQDALCCTRLFYAHNPAVARYLLTRQQPDVPFSVLGFNPPHDYCWLIVK
ncbi:MAG TPA: methyltransferase domain-containing protein [Ktedonobacteraceae bacterium]|nr:methyltransferase domain-containing protein [Ktedonobacteraceae bacterium]